MSTLALISTRDQYERLLSIYLPIALGVFAFIVAAVLVAVLRYRGRARAARWCENNRLEISYAGLLVLTAAFLLWVTLSAEHRVDTVANRERLSLTVDVTAAKWEWQFVYPGYGIVARSGTVGRQPLVVPAHAAIRFNLAAQDVIHSLWVPELRFKRDLIPGALEHVTLTVTHTGLFTGQCAQFCGLRHAGMVFNVRVLSVTAFGDWARAHRAVTA